MLGQICGALVFLLGGVMDVDERSDFASIPAIYASAVQIVFDCDGVRQTFGRDNAEFAQIMAALDAMSLGSHDMPAFGVSLDAETRAARKSGLWLELVFAEEQYFNGYNFESLLFEVRADDAGFNLNRKVNGKYEGRCLYLSLAGDMQILAETLTALCQPTN